MKSQNLCLPGSTNFVLPGLVGRALTFEIFGLCLEEFLEFKG